ncbi:MAG: hypothetical protein IKI83_03985 [Prevotella sp.]|nr:hypothetical protein [Prevotella sp.]
MKVFNVFCVLVLLALLCGCKKHGRLGVGDDLDTLECANVHLYDEKPTIMMGRKTEYKWIDSDGKTYPIYLTDTMCYVVKECESCSLVFYKQLDNELFKEITKEKP